MDVRLVIRWRPIGDESKSTTAFLGQLSRQSLDAADDAEVVVADSKFVKFSPVTNGVTNFLAKRPPYSTKSAMVAF